MKFRVHSWRQALFCLLLLGIWAGVAMAASTAGQKIVVLSPKTSLDSFLQRNQLRLVKCDENSRILLVEPAVEVSDEELSKKMSADGDVKTFELNNDLQLPEASPSRSAQLNQSTVALLNQSTVALLNDATTVNYFGANVKSSYVQQPALRLIRNDQAHQLSSGAGIIVADIDSGVDPYNPILKNILVSGYNFLNDNRDVSEWADLDQSTVALLNQNWAIGLDQSTVSLLNQSTVSLLNQSTVSLLNQSTVALLNQSTVALLNQSTVALLNQSTVALLNQLPPAFGHGTMVASLIHVVAPNARLQPLKAFRADGTGTLFDVVRALYYAADNGADVINMSFSFPASSKVLQSAISYARNRGVFLVSSMGNAGLETSNTFPAAYSGVFGIAATDNQDVVAPFSNYGSATSYSAPGVNLVTIFPGGHYALVSGTSFSSGLVSGLAALSLSARDCDAGRVMSAMDRAAVNIDRVNPSFKKKLGKGRVDAPDSITNMLSQ